MLSIKYMMMFIWLYDNFIQRKWINNEHTALWAALLSILIKEWSLIWWNFVEYFGGNGRILWGNHWYGLVSRILMCMDNIRWENSSRGEKLRWIKKLFGIIFYFFLFFSEIWFWRKKKQKVFFIPYFVQGFNLLPAFRYIVTYYLHMVQIRNATVCFHSLVKSTPFCYFCQFLFDFCDIFFVFVFLKIRSKTV
jgi:hypothetical protein